MLVYMIHFRQLLRLIGKGLSNIFPCKLNQDSQMDSVYSRLHVFSDASCGVLQNSVVHLLSCRTMLAPFESIVLPRLELCGAVLA